MAATTTTERQARLQAIADRVAKEEAQQNASVQREAPKPAAKQKRPSRPQAPKSRDHGEPAYGVYEAGKLVELSSCQETAQGYEGDITPHRVKFTGDYRVCVWPVADDDFHPISPLDVPAFSWPTPSIVGQLPHPYRRPHAVLKAFNINREILDGLQSGEVPQRWAICLEIGEAMQQTLVVSLADDFGIESHSRVTACRVLRPTAAEIEHYSPSA